MRAIIFANGQLKACPSFISRLLPNDLIIAADGGFRHCKMFNISPHLIIGDLDSINQNDLKQIKAIGTEILQFPARKDETDLELALKTALERGAQEIIITGALGGRWDMTFSNVLLLSAKFLKDISVRILDHTQEIYCIRDGQCLNIHNRIHQAISLLPLTESVEGVTLHGMEYMLNNGTFVMGSTQGLSNIIINNEASIKVSRGILLAIISS